MISISINPLIYNACPQFVSAQLECSVKNSEFNKDLWTDIEIFIKEFRQKSKIKDINKFPPILATRNTYKKLGKDPNRYRPAGEALRRRVIKGAELYKINTLVDAINLISLKTGYSIGGFDANLVQGSLELGVGQKDEKFEAIARGFLNIEGLPVYRDSVGGIGTPTSDEERTKISLETKRLLMLMNAYSGKEGLEEAIEYAIQILKKYAGAEDIEVRIIER
ncbi:MAG: phenylalanine--tRNA ligase beta subunit-related protein [Dysgonamonadaceae bacterium]|jgi:DNA/RNA-binding domain of Phe-tRNA-synthetase-like protein|nr:phenylalanine--tRNA ligase beta subunit-related protein [Dysgonamonadaceae bacterium]MDD3355609.1 phenylalanine--tRNA ligase beta subunit-related protein [Dysgonamonadaceae bacterium]MDD3727040.1 phenylalanine--tRNA ligase beta subunit-related protein [Dysgonamonadaceae bacterium]MDD4246962.1 phenylalanine--tRNA ligase beta subunit-related protein [Dysgonamonadaceae bacterium]MDD4605631.1 phenylalanine--tRNA ligase beta subunit-related protein [Dysgonamonadaceae bacterium]